MDDNTFKFLSLLVLSLQTVALAYIGVRQQQTHTAVNSATESLTAAASRLSEANEEAR